MSATPIVRAQSTHCDGHQYRGLRTCVLNLQGAPSAARKVGPTECRADDAAAVAAGASHHVHGTTKDAEGADHPHLHGTAAVAGATGLSPITVAPVGACDPERTTAGAADAADPACTSRTAFFSKSYIPLASVWRSGARSGGDTESH